MNNKERVRLFFFCKSNTDNRKELFENALNSAKLGHVLYILREEIMELPQLLQNLNSTDRHYMKLIRFLYAKNLKSLVESLSSLPDWDTVPVTIIIEDLNEYCPKDQLHQSCALIAFALDTIQSCSDMLAKECNLLLSINVESFGIDYCNLIKEIYQF